MKRQLIIVTTLLIGVMGMGLIAATPSYAASKDDFFKGCNSEVNCDGAKTNTDLKTSVWHLIRTALMILGGLAVFMIIAGGIMFTASAGDQGRVKAAKNTVMYSAIGLVVAMSATAIITLVLDYFG